VEACRQDCGPSEGFLSHSINSLFEELNGLSEIFAVKRPQDYPMMLVDVTSLPAFDPTLSKEKHMVSLVTV
jgi:hypothetical protein